MTREPSPESQFTATLAREINRKKLNNYAVAQLADGLRRLSRIHCRLQEAKCNRELTPRDLRAEERIERRIAGLLRPYRIQPIFSGDPRGCTVKLKMPSGITNDFAQEGVCVPQ